MHKLHWLNKACWISLPVLAYFSLHYKAFSQSTFYNHYYSFLLFVFLVGVDLVMIKYSRNIHRVAKALLYSCLLIFLFGTNLNDLLLVWLAKLGDDFTIPGRYIALFFVLLIFYIQFKINKKNTSIKFQNAFWLILIGLQTIQYIVDKKEAEKISFNPSYTQLNKSNHEQKNTLLLILDEYSSPEELNKLKKANRFSLFSDSLKAHGWITKNQFLSHEVSTIHSLGSMLNFNLSKNKAFSDVNPWQIAERYFLQSSPFLDSLKAKHIQTINWGILDLGEIPKMSRLYFYPTNYLDLISSFTIIPSLQIKGRAFNFAGITLSLYPSEQHNKKLISHLNNKINKLENRPHFIYAHLFMPHSPIIYSPYIKKENFNLENYITYWQFTNELISPLLKEFEKQPNLKVIITGDHGLRNINSINPKNTFAGFWGFDQEDVNKIQSVQDIGSLINAYY